MTKIGIVELIVSFGETVTKVHQANTRRLKNSFFVAHMKMDKLLDECWN